MRYFRVAKRVFHRRSPQPHSLRSGPFVHAIQCLVVQVTCDSRGGKNWYNATSADRLRTPPRQGVGYGTIFPR